MNTFFHIGQVFTDNNNHGSRVYIGKRAVGLFRIDKTDVMDDGDTAPFIIVAGCEEVTRQQDG